MARDTDQDPSRRRAVVVTFVASGLLLAGGLLALKRSVDEDLPRFPPPRPTTTSSAPAASSTGPTGASRPASG